MLTYAQDAQDAVDTMIGQGTRFEQIEDYIDMLPLPSEHRSALWLLAWAETTNPATRRQIVTETLALEPSQLAEDSRGARQQRTPATPGSCLSALDVSFPTAETRRRTARRLGRDPRSASLRWRWPGAGNGGNGE